MIAPWQRRALGIAAFLAATAAGWAADGVASSPAPAGAVAPPAAAPVPPARAGPVRAIASDAIGADKAKAYLVYSHPLLPSEGARWIAFGRREDYTEKRGASEVRGSRYDVVFRTVFERTGQMIFELEPGRYEVALYASPDLDRRLSKEMRFDLVPGDIKTASVRRMLQRVGTKPQDPDGK
ncbi:MAG: hypothetical protein FJ221_05460 [Lentisphaerae bacterium]|nr:hypothetical protein [Lentisphaerota bacterium]